MGKYYGLIILTLRKIPVSREDTFWIEQTSKDTSLLTLCEQLVFCVLKDGKSSVLLKILTSLLSMHVGALRILMCTANLISNLIEKFEFEPNFKVVELEFEPEQYDIAHSSQT